MEERGVAGGRLAAIEAGGTKVLCALADREGAILAQARIETADPDATFVRIAAFYAEACARFGGVAAGGAASFGPLQLDPAAPGFGRLTTTPKPGWSGVDMLGRLRAILTAPVAIDTDVTCAAAGEAEHGAGRGLERLAYVTVGTGIGVGLFDRGGRSHATGHLEAGHLRAPRARGDDAFAGTCPYHGDCLEGLACGPAMAARWGRPAEALPADHPGWEVEAHYLACLCADLTYALRPQRIVLGGGVMAGGHLLPRVRRRFRELTGGYALDRWSGDADAYLAEAVLVDPSPGLLGALALARTAASDPAPR